MILIDQCVSGRYLSDNISECMLAISVPGILVDMHDMHMHVHRECQQTACRALAGVTGL